MDISKMLLKAYAVRGLLKNLENRQFEGTKDSILQTKQGGVIDARENAVNWLWDNYDVIKNQLTAAIQLMDDINDALQNIYENDSTGDGKR